MGKGKFILNVAGEKIERRQGFGEAKPENFVQKTRAFDNSISFFE